MTMETFCLADHQRLSNRSNLSREETFRTRLLQIDRPLRSAIRDPLQHSLRKIFRWLWFNFPRRPVHTPTSSENSKNAAPAGTKDIDVEGDQSCPCPPLRRCSSFNTAWLADTTSRFIFGLLTGALLIGPMAILLNEQVHRSTQLVVVSLFVILLSFLVALASRASPQETIAASAAYAAVLVVFISTTNNCVKE